MPIWANSGTFTVTPSASFQNDGFDPTLPFPVEFLNWKLNELDMGGYFEHATGASNHAAAMRGGDTTTGVITEVKVDDAGFAVTKYTGGTLDSPTGPTTILNYSDPLSLWSFQGGQVTFDSLVTPAEGLNTDPNTTTNLRYGYATNPVFHIYFGEALEWTFLQTGGVTSATVRFVHTAGVGATYTELFSASDFSMCCSVPLGAYNTEAGTTMTLTNLECEARTTGGVAHSGTLELVAKPRNGNAEIVLASDTIPNGSTFATRGAAVLSHAVDLSANIYFVRVVSSSVTGTSDTIDIKNLRVTASKLAVE